MKDIAASTLRSLGLFALEVDSRHAVRILKQPCGESYMGRISALSQASSRILTAI